MASVFFSGRARQHGVIAAIIGCNVAVLLAAAIRHGKTTQALAYLSAVAISIVAIDGLSSRRRKTSPPIPVRDPRLESLVLIGSALIAFAWLISRLVLNYQPQSGVLRLAWLAILLGAVYFVFPAVFLVSRRYRATDLGLRFRGITTAFVVLAIFACATLVFSRQSVTWTAAMAEGGSLLGLVSMAISACVPEEFFRFAWQTRIGTWMKNPAAGWLIASIAWALLHGPVDYSQSHSIGEATLGVLNIVPLGLLWGHLTHRTGSFVPSMLLHGLNLWGLQNL